MAVRRLWLVELRRQKNVTQAEVADAVGLPRTTYANIEQGTRGTKYAKAKQIADYFDIPIDWMFLGPGGATESKRLARRKARGGSGGEAV